VCDFNHWLKEQAGTSPNEPLPLRFPGFFNSIDWLKFRLDRVLALSQTAAGTLTSLSYPAMPCCDSAVWETRFRSASSLEGLPD
jgi:hypothetical protein